MTVPFSNSGNTKTLPGIRTSATCTGAVAAAAATGRAICWPRLAGPTQIQPALRDAPSGVSPSRVSMCAPRSFASFVARSITWARSSSLRKIVTRTPFCGATLGGSTRDLSILKEKSKEKVLGYPAHMQSNKLDDVCKEHHHHSTALCHVERRRTRPRTGRTVRCCLAKSDASNNFEATAKLQPASESPALYESHKWFRPEVPRLVTAAT